MFFKSLLQPWNFLWFSGGTIPALSQQMAVSVQRLILELLFMVPHISAMEAVTIRNIYICN